MSWTTPRRPQLVLAVLCLVILLDALDLSITQVALPAVQAELNVPDALLPWVVNAYVLTYGGLLLFGGRVGDLVGRRRSLLIGLALFGLGSAVCGLAGNEAVLIAARAVQGVGAALTVPAAVATIAATFTQGPDRDRALGVFAAFASAGFSLGLVLGGVLTSALGWPAIFWVKVPLVILTAVAATLVVPSDPGWGVRQAWDVPGAVLGTAGLLLVAYAVTTASSPATGWWVAAGCAALGLLTLAGFVAVERRSPAPLLPLNLFRQRVVAVGDLASLTVLAAPFGFAFLTTAYLQTVLGWSALQTGLGLLPGAALSAVMSRWAAPRLLARLGLRATGSIALLVVGAGFAVLILMTVDAAYVTVVLPASIVCLGLGMGLAYPVYTVAAVTGVAEDRQGVAAGVQNTALQIGGGLGLAVVSAVVAAAAYDDDPDRLVSALRIGALAGCALPLLGAVLTAAWMRPASDPTAIPTDQTQEARTHDRSRS